MGQLFGPTNPAADAGWQHTHPRKGFFTDTSVCIGCKACEVACKEWNHVPSDPDPQLLGSSYDNTGGLGANTWRHVAFVEQDAERIARARRSGRALVDLGMPSVGPPPGRGTAGASAPGGGADGSAAGGAGGSTGGADDYGGLHDAARLGPPVSTGVPGDGPIDTTPPDTPEFRWLMSSDVCKHCTHAGCLDACPTGALFRTEFGSVVVQDDVCNGCGTCVAACPFGVIERRSDGTAAPGERGPQQGPTRESGIAQKCTLCYDRLTDGQQPACAQTCPTESIRFGNHEELVATARERVAELHARGMTEARLYGANQNDGVGGTGSVFLLLDEPETYGLPPDPRVPTADLPQMFSRAGWAAAGMLATAALAFLGRRR